MKNNRFTVLGICGMLVLSIGLAGCDPDPTPQAASGVKKANVAVQTDATTGLTVEQRNVADRLALDNKPGSIKHLYVIAPDSGQVILYSTVRGKVTSSGKRLNPRTVNPNDAFAVQIGNERHYTSEVLEDDGTYGSSVDYIFWWDVQGRYHQHFFTGGQIIHVSDYPITVKSVILNLDAADPGLAKQ